MIATDIKNYKNYLRFLKELDKYYEDQYAKSQKQLKQIEAECSHTKIKRTSNYMGDSTYNCVKCNKLFLNS